MKTLLKISILLLLMLFCTIAQAESLSQSAANYVSENYTMQQNGKQIIFSPDKIQRKGEYAALNSPAFFSDGSSTDGLLEDVVFILCLEKKTNWTIIYDLSRSDVPSPEELEYIRQEFPKHFPVEILPEFWQKLLQNRLEL